MDKVTVQGYAIVIASLVVAWIGFVATILWSQP